MGSYHQIIKDEKKIWNTGSGWWIIFLLSTDVNEITALDWTMSRIASSQPCFDILLITTNNSETVPVAANASGISVNISYSTWPV